MKQAKCAHTHPLTNNIDKPDASFRNVRSAQETSITITSGAVTNDLCPPPPLVRLIISACDTSIITTPVTATKGGGGGAKRIEDDCPLQVSTPNLDVPSPSVPALFVRLRCTPAYANFKHIVLRARGRGAAKRSNAIVKPDCECQGQGAVQKKRC